MAAHIGDLEAIASTPIDLSSPVCGDVFDSILGAYDRAGALLWKIEAVYDNYISSLNTPDMQVCVVESRRVAIGKIIGIIRISHLHLNTRI